MNVLYLKRLVNKAKQLEQTETKPILTYLAAPIKQKLYEHESARLLQSCKKFFSLN